MVNEDTVRRHRDFLKTFAAFKDFHPNELLLLARQLKEKRYEKGEVVCSEREPGDSCFFVVFGRIGVYKELLDGRNELLAHMKSGNVFGQISLIDGQPRSATCISAERSLLLELSKESFDRLFDAGESFAFRLQELFSKAMVRQLREADDKLSSMVKKARTMEIDLNEVFLDMVGALKSVEELSINLDDVTYEIAEGQKRDLSAKAKCEEGYSSKRKDTAVNRAVKPGLRVGEYSVGKSELISDKPTLKDKP